MSRPATHHQSSCLTLHRYQMPFDSGAGASMHLYLPKGWKCQPESPRDDADPGSLQPVALALPPASREAFVAGWQTTLEREVAPEDWLRTYTEARGETLIDDERLPGPDDSGAVLLARGGEGRGEFTTAWAALKRGRLLVVVRAAAAGRSEARRALMRTIAASARLEGGSTWPFAERLTRLSPRKPVDFVTLYPESWEAEIEAENSPEITAIRLRNRVGGVPCGEIAVTTLSDGPDAAPEAIAQFIAEFAGRQGDASPQLQPEVSDPPPGAEAAWRASSMLTRGEAQIELDVRIFRAQDTWLVISHWRPVRRHGAKTWAINRRAMDLVLRFLRFSAPASDDVDYAPLLAAHRLGM